MFGSVAGSVDGRWRDIGGLSDEGRLVAGKIKRFVPNGNIPCIGSPKWSACVLFNLVQPMDADHFWAVADELCEKRLFALAFTYQGHDYGYYREFETLAANVIAHESEFDQESEFDVAKVSFVFVLPEDIQLVA